MTWKILNNGIIARRIQKRYKHEEEEKRKKSIEIKLHNVRYIFWKNIAKYIVHLLVVYYGMIEIN